MRICDGPTLTLTLLLNLLSTLADNLDQVVVQLDVKKVDQAKRIAQSHGMRFLSVVRLVSFQCAFLSYESAFRLTKRMVCFSLAEI